MSSRVPAPSAIFVGRDEPLQRVERALVRVPVALICGVPGIGKSTLAFAIAERWGRRAVYRRITRGEPLGRLIDRARSAVTGGSVPELDDDDDRIADLAERLDEAHALLVIDDLHRLASDDPQQLILGLGPLLHRGRLLATTRERPELGIAIDRLELGLTGLDEDSARELWAALDGLYQPSPGFELAWRRSQGNPLVLRQAHRGRPAVDPYAAAIAELSADERHVASLLATGTVPLSTTRLARLLPDARVCYAVRGLHARLMVDIYPDKTCALHALFRDEVQRTMSAEERAISHAVRARVLLDAELDVVTKVREVCRHLGELDRFDDAAQVLAASATELVRRGAAQELLGSLEAIPQARRNAIARVLHARALGRVLDLRGAHRALAQLLDSGAEPRAEVLLGFAPVALVTGQLAAAERALAELLARRDLAPWPRVCAQFASGVLCVHQGRADDARALLHRAVADAPSREAEAVLVAAEVYGLWLDERDRELADPVRRVSALLQGGASTLHGMLVAPAVLALALARLGRFPEAERWRHQLAERLGRSGDARARLIARLVLAYMDYERGARAEAMAGLTEAADQAEHGGDLVVALRARAYVARLLLLAGRRRQALVLLDEVAGRARALGLASLVQAVERSRLLDPLLQLRAPGAADDAGPKIGALVRARCMAALRAARDADRARVEALLDANAPLVTGADHVLDRALGHLAQAVLARAQGDGKQASSALADARRQAQAGEVDPDVLDELDAELGHLRVVTGERARLRASFTEVASADSIVLDGRSHELRVGGRVHALRRQAMLRGILYALSEQVGRVVTKQEVAMRLWGGRYDPTVHDNRLWANIRRLRLFLARSGLHIESIGDGYRLSPSHGFVFVAPLG
jgi:DNA-binding response OmpR family regulator